MRRSVARGVVGLAMAALIAAAAYAASGVQSGGMKLSGAQFGVGTHASVGPKPGGVSLTPVNQELTPAGTQVDLPGMRPQALALSPDGRLLVTSGKTAELVVADPVSGAILQRVPFPAESGPAPGAVSPNILEPDKTGEISYTGLVFSPDGSRIFLSNVNGSVKVFSVSPDHTVTGLYSLALPPTGVSKRKAALPAGLAVSNDGSRLYVALNLSNRLAELDTATGKTLRTFDVGVAPFGVVLAGGKAYVSNWGGRRPGPNSLTGPAGQGTRVRVDPTHYISNEGSISVIDLASGKVEKEIITGRGASGLARSPDGHYLLAACSGAESVDVVDIRTNRVVETISLKLRRKDPLETGPNALAFDPTGTRLYVCCGSLNAVAVVAFQPGHSRLLGVIPTGWYPGAVIYDAARQRIDTANIEGTGSWRFFPAGEKPKYNSHQYYGTLSLINVPNSQELAHDTLAVTQDDRRGEVLDSLLPPRRGQPPRPVPERSGEPSPIKHVVYIIKENRTYDQVMGDIKEGNGDPDLCVFGAGVTPNIHQLAKDFVLLDNTNCCSVLSADGHEWADSAFGTDYLERSFCGWPRSYPDGMSASDVDALAYSPAGFLWDDALAHHKTLRDFGEFTIGETGWAEPDHTGRPHFLDFYHDFLNHTALTKIGSRPSIQSLAPYIDKNTIGWDLSVPDVFRAAQFAKELDGFDQKGVMPDLSIICLPDDHTSGTGAGAPTPRAQVADNDLALGRIVQSISHSRFWKDTAIFVIEDDPQSGWDHLSSFRTEALVISPYVRRHAVVSTNYNHTSLLRTMELILGLPPMTAFDASATPMTDCFTDHPDFTPYDAVPNLIPLDEMNPSPQAIRDPVRRHYALVSAHLPLKQADQCPDDLLNHILWNAQKGNAPYPAKNVGKLTAETQRSSGARGEMR
ncbi:MAG TPA: alkaline phosphatase family protein [Armatimonadota bacterium]|nr:alkaline phosphatase family protein [Armatimonadota bacterium]